jgi:hypothetical protein
MPRRSSPLAALMGSVWRFGTVDSRIVVATCGVFRAVIVTGLSDRPAGGNAAVQVGTVYSLCSVHQPDRDIATGAAPQNVGVSHFDAAEWSSIASSTAAPAKWSLTRRPKVWLRASSAP